MGTGMRWARAFANLDDLGVREAAAIAGARWDELVDIQSERQRLLGSLPAPPPPEAKPALERALARTRETQQALVAVMAETKGTLERLQGGRRALNAYGGPRARGLERRA
jgi:anti-sigma factor RsiW